MTRRSCSVLAAAAGLAVSGAAFGQFSGPYAPGNWTFNANGGNGSVNTGGAPAQIALTGNDNGFGPIDTDFTIAAATGGTMAFHWVYSSGDTGTYDTAYYLINGTQTFLGTNSGPFSGDVSIGVNAGDIIGFRVNSADGVFGPGTVTISNFSIGGAPPPTGRCCLFNGTCSVVTQAACTSQGGTWTAGGNCSTQCTGGVPPVIYTNCGLSTGATSLSGAAAPVGSTWSECPRYAADPTTQVTTAGFAGSGAFRLADDFVVGAGGMNLGYVKFPIYTTGATAITTTAVTLQIWQGGPPGVGTLIFGDTTTNRMANVEFSNIYRIFNTAGGPACGGTGTAPGTTRRQQMAYVTVNQNLAPGTYWLDWGYTGGTFSPLATSPTAIGEQCNPNNANAMQFNAAWGQLFDAGQGCAPVPTTQDMYFELLGTAGGSGCYANCDGSTTIPFLNVLDFSCFLNKFAAGNTYANCDGSTTPPTLNVLDFSCFLNKFAAGCSAP
jgi:hypothetical protein